MFSLINGVQGLAKSRVSRWLAGSAAVMAMGVPTVAMADRDHDRHDDRRPVERREVDRHEFDRRFDDHRDSGPRIEIRPPGLGIDIRIGDRSRDRVYCPPVYRTVCEQVWVAPVYRTDCVRTWVPDRYESREVRFFDHGQWCTRIEQVLVEPGHSVSTDQQVCVSPGHYETVERQVLVSAGYYR